MSSTARKNWAEKATDFVKWDQLGIGLSILCAVHCLMLPLVILSLPIMARYYLANPFFHMLLAAMILPVGLFAFITGFKHHGNWKVFAVGIPALLSIVVTPYLVHGLGMMIPEAPIMILGSLMLIVAHWMNRTSCRTCHDHQH